MNKNRVPLLSKTIKGASSRAGYSIRSLSKEVGIPYPTFITRLRDPGGWRVCELKAVFRKLDLNPNEVEEVGKEIGIV